MLLPTPPHSGTQPVPDLPGCPLTVLWLPGRPRAFRQLAPGCLGRCIIHAALVCQRAVQDVGCLLLALLRHACHGGLQLLSSFLQDSGGQRCAGPADRPLGCAAIAVCWLPGALVRQAGYARTGASQTHRVMPGRRHACWLAPAAGVAAWWASCMRRLWAGPSSSSESGTAPFCSRRYASRPAAPAWLLTWSMVHGVTWRCQLLSVAVSAQGHRARPLQQPPPSAWHRARLRRSVGQQLLHRPQRQGSRRSCGSP